MINHITVRPNEVKRETRILIKSKDYQSYTGAYVGRGTYCWNMRIDNGIEFDALDEHFSYNVQIGRYNSIANNLSIMIGKTHNMRCVESGALGLFLREKNCVPSYEKGVFNQKGSVIIQNDVWIGQDAMIMPNTIIRNGAVVATKAHVVSDVPPYAVVGGNPAKIIGYRFPMETIEKLQVIRWWDWDEEKLLKNASYFTEDVELFLDRFYQEEQEKLSTYAGKIKATDEDTWFTFVDYYEAYSGYAHILESFLDTFLQDTRKKLILFIQDDCGVDRMDETIQKELKNIVDEIQNTPDIKCKVIIERGTCEKAEEIFLQCQHYIVTRSYRAVHFSCLADLLGIELVSGVDSRIPFLKETNIIKNRSE